MIFLESPCNVENCIFSEGHPGHSIIEHHLLDTRVCLQVKADHWLFTEIIAKVVEEADLDYPTIRALGKSIGLWAQRHKVPFFECIDIVCFLNFRFLTKRTVIIIYIPPQCLLIVTKVTS